MKIEKFKVLLFLKKTEPDKSGKAPIMGRITLNRTVAQFSTKLSCTPKLWNVRENRLEGKSREAVETNAKIEKLLLAIHAAFNELQERKRDFGAADVRNLFQGSMETQMTLLRLFDRHIEETRERIGIDVCASSMSTYHYARKTLGEFVRKKYKVKDIAFGALNEQFIREYQSYIDLTASSGPAETDLPDSVQGRVLRAVPFPAFQDTQAEGDHPEGVEPRGLREAA